MNKWTLIKMACALFSATAVIVACTDAKHRPPEGENAQAQIRVNAKGIMEDPDLTDQQKSTNLVAAGEQLLMPETFHLAYEVFSQALVLDAENKHAAIYVELLKPTMNLKGILGRIEPLVAKDEREYPAYKEQLDREEFFVPGYYNGRPHPDDQSEFSNWSGLWGGSYVTVEFLADDTGMTPISDEKELQEFVRSQVEAFDNLRKFLNQNIANEYTIKLNERFAADRATQRANTCRFTIITDWDYNVECSHNPNFMTVKVDRGDLEALKAIAAGMQIYHIIGSAYDLSEAHNHAMNFRGANSGKSDREMIETVLETNSDSGKLNEDNMLSSVLNLGKDAMIGARWIRENHATMCPGQNDGMAFYHRGFTYNPETGVYDSPRRVLLRREGKLFDRGLCWDEIYPQHSYQEMGQIFDTIDKALVGEEIEIRSWEMVNVVEEDGNVSKRNSGNKVAATIKPSVFFSNPIQDIRNVRPSRYNDCGSVKEISDATAGGIFVNGDANTFLQKTNMINRDEAHCQHAP